MKRKINFYIVLFISFILLVSCESANFDGHKDNGMDKYGTLKSQESNILTMGTEEKLSIPRRYTLIKGREKDSVYNTEFDVYGVIDESDNEINSSSNINKRESESSIDNVETQEVELPVNDSSIIFYAIYGIDLMSPDENIDSTQVKSSMDKYLSYAKNTLSITSITLDSIAENDEEGNSVLENSKTIPRTSSDGKWYYTSFTCYSGKSISTSYNTACFPKTYYGIILLSKDLDQENKRYWRIYIFSNNQEGKTFSEEDYNDIFEQIKESYQLRLFYTIKQLNYDSELDTHNGLNYQQFSNLFINTKNYYVMAKNGAIQSDEESKIDLSIGIDKEKKKKK